MYICRLELVRETSYTLDNEWDELGNVEGEVSNVIYFNELHLPLY